MSTVKVVYTIQKSTASGGTLLVAASDPAFQSLKEATARLHMYIERNDGYSYTLIKKTYTEEVVKPTKEERENAYKQVHTHNTNVMLIKDLLGTLDSLSHGRRRLFSLEYVDVLIDAFLGEGYDLYQRFVTRYGDSPTEKWRHQERYSFGMFLASELLGVSNEEPTIPTLASNRRFRELLDLTEEAELVYAKEFLETRNLDLLNFVAKGMSEMRPGVLRGAATGEALRKYLGEQKVNELIRRFRDINGYELNGEGLAKFFHSNYDKSLSTNRAAGYQANTLQVSPSANVCIGESAWSKDLGQS